jgi:hypothetical protein
MLHPTHWWKKVVNRYKNSPMNGATVAAILAVGILCLGSPGHAAEHAAEAEKAAAEKYEREALAFEEDADLHTRIAERCRAPDNGGSKQRMTLWSLANHHEWLAKSDREAAQRARAMAAMHRQPANAR